MSLWQNAIETYQPKHRTLPTQQFDVIIAGGGVTGISTALQLQKAGKKCLVVESHTLCFGTTGGTTAHLNTFLDTSYKQIKKDFGEDGIHLVASATQKALELYKHNIETYNIDCSYEQKDGYLYAIEDEQVKELDEIFQASKDAGVDVAYTDRILTPQYEGLEALQRSYADKGFSVLGFPCNQFGAQEPGNAEEIANFCKLSYDVSFPLMGKIDVNGDDAAPIYNHLKASARPARLQAHQVEFHQIPGRPLGQAGQALRPADQARGTDEGH